MSKKNKTKNNNTVFAVSHRVSLPINQTPPSEFIPKEVSFENNAHILEQVSIALNRNMPVLLVGETGSGKTSLVRHLATKTHNAFRRVNHNGGTSVDDILGKILINEKGTYWIDGVLIDAMRKGYWYLADELNASSAEITFAYHSLLDDDGFIVLPENGGEVVRPHANFRFFGAMNPSTDYSGTKELNKALLSRFVVVKTDFPSPSVEAKILINRTGVSKEVADKLISFAAEVRANQGKGKYGFVLSTRELIMWAQLYGVYGKYLMSAEATILNKVSAEDLESIKDLAGMHFKNLDTPKPKAPQNAPK